MCTPSTRQLCATTCLLFLMSMACGCTTARALRRSTVQQADTVADIHQQQVLDNLAKFVRDPYAIPSFAYATAGTAEVTDKGSGVFGLSWDGTAFSGATLGGEGSRDVRDNWTTTPVTEPRKLELMRCAYQRAIASCGFGPGESISCPDCRKRFNKFYTGREYESKMQDDCRCFNCDGTELANLVPGPFDDPCICGICPCEPPCGTKDDYTDELPDVAEAIRELPANGESVPPGVSTEKRTEGDRCRQCFCNKCASPGSGIVNSECLYSPCWFCVGCKKSVPKHCSYVGHHCGTYVWVPPGPSRDVLARLTLAILDYAVNEDLELPSKDVTVYLTRNGTPTTSDCAELVVEATIPVDEPSLAVIQSDVPSQSQLEWNKDAGAEDLEKSLLNRIRQLPPVGPRPRRRSPTPNAGLPLLQQQLRTVD